jgi:hypothetical protein
VGHRTFLLREKFKTPNNIEEIVDKSKNILCRLKGSSDTKYLLKRIEKLNINIGDLNAYWTAPHGLET